MPTQLRVASAVGVVVALLVCAWMVTAGSFALLERQHRAADFYDAQAQSFLNGRWDLPQGILGIEAFEIGGQEYTYFGIVPALMRLPVAAFSENFDGRLTQISMLAAIGVALAALNWASWATRWSIVGDAPLRRKDLAMAVFIPVAAGCSSLILFLASRPWVYHEAILWGIAASVVSLVALFRFLLGAGLRSLVLACLMALVALHSRASVGAGPLFALTLAGLLVLIAAARNRRQAGDGAGRGGTPNSRLAAMVNRCIAPKFHPRRIYVVVLAATLAAAALSYIGVNMARFGEPIRLPLERQTYALMSPERQAVLDANNGSLFGVQFIPTTTLQYLRPDALSFSRTFPFIGFPPPATVVGDVEFDTLDPSGSMTATMPALAVGAMGGLWVIVSAARKGKLLAAWIIPVMGALAGAATCFVFGYVANRYQGDALPFLLLASLPALHFWIAKEKRRTKWELGALIVLVGWGTLANGALALSYQRQVAPDVRDDLRAALLSTQIRAARWLPGARTPSVIHGQELPHAPAGEATLFVLGECDGLYLGDERGWHGVERTTESGRWSLEVEWPVPEVRGTWPLISVGDGDGANILVARRSNEGTRIGYIWDDEQGVRHELLGRPIHIEGGERSHLEVIFDPYNVEIRVQIDDYLAYEGYRFNPRIGEPRIGADASQGGLTDRFPGRVWVAGSHKAPLCGQLWEGE